MKKILLVFFVLPFISFAQSLSGNYNIGTGQSSPFNTLQNAISHINTVGVNGPVVFHLLNNETPSSTLTINSFSGSSAVNTLTIRPSDNQDITISINSPNGYTGVAAVIKINGGDNIIIDGSNGSSSNSRNLTLLNSNTVNYTSQTVFWVASNGTNAATNVTLQNTVLKHSNRNQVGRWLSGVYSGGNGNTGNNDLENQVATANNTNTKIINNEFVNIRQGIHINSNTNTNRITDVVIKDNRMVATIDSQKPDLGIYISNVSGFTIENNVIDGLLSNTTGSANMYGMNILNGINYDITGNQILNYSHPSNHMIGAAMFIQGNSTSNAIITRNVIRDIVNSGGGIVRGIDINISGSSNTNTVVSNNFISGVSTSGTTSNNGNGIFIRAGRDISIYHNTIAMNTNQNNTHAALYINGGSQLNVINNILSNTSNSGTRYAIYSGVARGSYTSIDYNNYYSTQHIGYLSSNRTLLSNWKTATQQDENSLDLLPNFVSTSDLHLTEDNPDLDNKGVFLSSVTIDIDEEIRSITTPDIGADEFIAKKCGTTTVWNGLSWSNGSPTESVKAVLNGNYNTSTHGSLNACELIVNTNITATITSDKYFKIETNLTIYGYLYIENNGSLVQVENDGVNSGNISLQRNTTPMKALDYTYWSSPVSNWKLNQLSPNTSASRYYTYNAATGNWVSQNGGNVEMEASKGYIVRAPNGWSVDNATNGIFSGNFTGAPNNGIFPVDVSKGPTNISNLIGNPYPSAIDIDAFILNSTNSAIFEGTIYLWTHNTAISNTIPGENTYNYTADDYATYNLTGGVKTSDTAITGGVASTGKIASGQAFFIDVKPSLADGNYQGVFTNDMRLVGQNGQFFRNSEENTETSIEKNRLWLHIKNAEGAYHETLLGYIEGATNDLDYGFDGKFIDGGNYVNIYSLLGTQKLSIQGRELPFDSSETIPLGYKSLISGAMSIGIEDTDGFFIGKTVYLHDAVTGETHTLNEGPYNFETIIGTFDNRFELRFENETLGFELPQATIANLKVFTNDGAITVSSPLTTIASVSVFDITGKQLAFYDRINSNHFETDTLFMGHQVLVVKTVFGTNQTIIRKIVF
ncbi:MAG: T9SS sorting signal type C domain-containing protein [Aquaticitalea sp.]